ncbi:MAG TPA: hypothetical protein VGI80_04735 [Pyrinomonadaceae bacterium]
MNIDQYTFWSDGEFFLGVLNDVPDYWTQACSLHELVENFASLRDDLDALGITKNL